MVAAGSGLAVAASLVTGSVAMAAQTFDVDTNSDDAALSACTTADNDCSLRGAVTRSNADPGSTITFASTVTGNINLLSDLPTIGAGQTILGPGAKVVTIDDGNHNGLAVDTGAGDVTISGLSISNSKYQGITSNGSGSLTVSRAIVTSNGGNGVRANSPVAIDHSTLVSNGKYAGSSGCGCAVGPNTAFGVYATAGLTMENSTVAYSGSIFTKYGGGVLVTHGATIKNSTIAINGPTTGVGIAADGAYALTLSSSIVAKNTGTATSGDVHVTNGGTLTENFSLIKDTTGLPPLDPTSGDNLNDQDPQFPSPPSLTDNGGPTPTMKPSAASPVIDQGKDFVGTGKDQRGVALFDAPGIPNAADGRDMGATEVQVPSISSITPDHAEVGDTVQIVGTDLSGATGVKFGSVDATGVNVVNDRHVNVVVPAGSGTVDVTLSTRVGTSPTAPGDRFTYGYQVDTKSDDASLTACTADHDDDCSLRGAITATNSNVGSTITFAPSVTGNITPATPLPIVSYAQTIVGPGADVLAIDATGLPSGLRADTTSSQVSVSGLTVKGADDFNFYSSGSGGPFVLTQVVASGSPAEGVRSLNDVVISGSTISGNQTGLHTYAGLTMRNSTVAGNSGTGVALGKNGTVTNSTISGNSTGLSANSGYSLNLQSTIVAGNASGDVSASTAAVTENFSLVENPSGLPATLEPSSGDNLNGQDPQLGPLGNNGGPTKTLRPAAASPVVDAGTDTAGTGKDQRGVALYDDPSVTNADDGRDVGAVELAVPAVSSVTPTTGNAGDTVTITGANLTGATGVKFGSADATGVQVVDGTHVTALAPAGSGTVDVTVVGPDGTSAAVAGDKFRYLAPPSVSSLSPGSGNAGDSVSITGTNLTGATSVKFGGTEATSFSVVDGTHVTAVVPAGSGTVDVRITAPDGTSTTSANDKFRYLAPPSVSSLSPDHGNAGDAVTITGANFTGATGVKFGSADATGVHVVDDTHLTAVAPAGSGTVDVTVIAPDGTSAAVAGDKFRYLAPPSVSSLSPDHGNAGDSVSITGTNLTGATSVKFGGTEATSFSVVDGTHVTAVVPAGSGTVDVRITAPDGTSTTSANDKFRYLAPPSVSSLSPHHGKAGHTVTVTGSHLSGATGVKFGGTEATSFSVVDDTHATAVAPAGSGSVHVTVITPDGTSPTTAGDKFTYDKSVPPPPKPPKHLTDRQVLKVLRRPFFSAHFVTKPKTLVFKSRLPEKGKARYRLILLKDRPHRGADERSALGDLTAVPSGGAHTATITIQLGDRGWRILRRNPTGTLVIHTSFKRKYNGHVIRTSRPIHPDNRPRR